MATTETQPQPKPATACFHLHAREEPAAPPHHRQLVCADCGAHIRYLANPETLAQRMQNAVKIEKLLSLQPIFEAWEANFIQTAARSRNGKLAPRQQMVLDALYEKHFPEEAEGA
jgi:hypothetical protein